MDDRPTDLRVDWRIAAGVAAALALLFTAQNFLAPPAIRAGSSFERLLQLQIITWGSWLALTPWIFAVARRWRRSRRYTPIAFARQVLIAFVISIAQSTLAGTLRWLGGISAFTDIADVIAASIVTSAGSNVLRYTMIAAAYHTVAYHREVRERDVRAARLESALLQAKLDSLQGRLQPHFLFNTLNSIGALIHDQPAAAERMLGSLADLLRASLRTDPSAEVPLEEELISSGTRVDSADALHRSAERVVRRRAGRGTRAVPHLLLQPPSRTRSATASRRERRRPRPHRRRAPR